MRSTAHGIACPLFPDACTHHELYKSCRSLVYGCPPRYKARLFQLFVEVEPTEALIAPRVPLRVISISKPPLTAAEVAAPVSIKPGSAPGDTSAASGTSVFGNSEEKTQAVVALRRTLVKYTPQSALLALDLARSEVAQEIAARDAAAKAAAEAAAATEKAAEKAAAAASEKAAAEKAAAEMTAADGLVDLAGGTPAK